MKKQNGDHKLGLQSKCGEMRWKEVTGQSILMEGVGVSSMQPADNAITSQGLREVA